MSSTLNVPLALHGGEPIRDETKRPWPLWPIHDERERENLLGVLDSGAWWYGAQVAAFEEAFAHHQDALHCVSCTNGTTAGEVMVQALNLEPGDEVIVPPYTFIATGTAVLRMGATPVFADVDESWCLDPDAAEAAITPRTKALMPVHFGSRVADMDRLRAVAERHGLVIIEDACHSWGSKWLSKGTGALGLAGFFSFQASKNISAGEGGAILTDDPDFAETCRSITNCGRTPGGGPWFHANAIGTNARITEFTAALLLAQLSRLQEQTTLRERNAAILDEALSEVEGLTPQPGDPRMTQRAYHLYPMRFDPEVFGCSRENFIAAARAEGLPVTAGYTVPLHAQPVFKNAGRSIDYAKVSCPVAEDLCYHSGVWFHHRLLLAGEDDMAEIAAIIRKVRMNAPKL